MIHVKEIIGDMRQTTRLAYGTKTKNWHIIQQNDRDWDRAITWQEIAELTESEAIAKYLGNTAL